MITVTFGDFVYLDRHDGIAIGEPGTRGSIWNYRDAKLCNVEKLFDMDGWEQIVAIVAAHLGADNGEILTRIQQAQSYYQNNLIRECWHGDSGPLAAIEGDITVEELAEIERRIEIEEAGRAAKRQHTKRRRAQFQAVRSDLVRRMLDGGHAYECAHPGCTVTTNLTIDHKVALSRGRTDDLSNLQFMCGPHNSTKRDGP